MNENSVVGVYKSLGDAEQAVRGLADSGFPVNKISIVAKQLEDEKQVHGYVTPGEIAGASAEAGAWMGGIFGLLVGAGFIWVPGFGMLIVAGSVSAILLGGIEGAVACAAVTGMLGWLAGLGISHEKLLKYEEALRAGKYLVIAQGSESSVNSARTILAKSSVEHLDTHAPTTT